MRDNAIFFPYINVPNSAWLTRILLYWDKVNSIVPIEYVLAPERLSPHMQEMVQLGLIEQIMPGAYLDSVPNFADSFLYYIDNEIQRRERSGKEIRTGQQFQIHVEKMEDIGERLVALGFAEQISYSWYGVEKWVARDFMAYLAAVLGNLEDVNAAPVTNDASSFEALAHEQLWAIRQSRHGRAGVRNLMINRMLPCPTGNIDIYELAQFKDQNSTLLERFRNYVEANMIDISNISDPVLREERLNLFFSETESTVDEITDVMKTCWRNITFGALVPILGAGYTLSQSDSYATALASGTGLIGAIYQAIQANRERRENLNQPLAYAALAHNHFGDF